LPKTKQEKGPFLLIPEKKGTILYWLSSIRSFPTGKSHRLGNRGIETVGPAQ